MLLASPDMIGADIGPLVVFLLLVSPLPVLVAMMPWIAGQPPHKHKRTLLCAGICSIPCIAPFAFPVFLVISPGLLASRLSHRNWPFACMPQMFLGLAVGGTAYYALYFNHSSWATTIVKITLPLFFLYEFAVLMLAAEVKRAMTSPVLPSPGYKWGLALLTAFGIGGMVLLNW